MRKYKNLLMVVAYSILQYAATIFGLASVVKAFRLVTEPETASVIKFLALLGNIFFSIVVILKCVREVNVIVNRTELIEEVKSIGENPLNL